MFFEFGDCGGGGWVDWDWWGRLGGSVSCVGWKLRTMKGRWWNVPAAHSGCEGCEVFQFLVKAFYGFAFFRRGNSRGSLIEDQRNEGISVEVGHFCS